MKRTEVFFVIAALLMVSVSASSADAHQTSAAVDNSQAPSGTEFLVRLEDTISTKDAKTGSRFQARTLEPLIAADGSVVRPGALLRGHVDKVEAGHKTGRARIWLTFDDLKTPAGWAPLVADVFDIPGVHSVKVDYNKESEIEARTSNRQQQAEAAAAGAFVGAAPGVAGHNGKDAAAGAAVGAATAFMAASGLGQELTLEKDTKLKLILERPLYLGRAD
jgi:hypothetical protein